MNKFEIRKEKIKYNRNLSIILDSIKSAVSQVEFADILVLTTRKKQVKIYTTEY